MVVAPAVRLAELDRPISAGILPDGSDLAGLEVSSVAMPSGGRLADRLEGRLPRVAGAEGLELGEYQGGEEDREQSRPQAPSRPLHRQSPPLLCLVVKPRSYFTRASHFGPGGSVFGVVP